MTRSLRTLGLVAALVALLVPAAARADGDPASDYLYTQSLFLPLDGSTPKASEAQLRQLLSDAKAKGYPIRVAVIGQRSDLGAVPSLFGKPDRYAPFLGQELRFLFKGPLLIVMPSGYGFYRFGHDTAKEQQALAQLPTPSEAPDLARAAVRAVPVLAAAEGITVEVPPLGAGTGHPWRHRLLIAAGGVVFALLVAAVALWPRRRTAEKKP